MTGSPISLPRAGNPALKTTTTHPNKPESSHKTFSISLPLNSIRRTASPSRPYGRYAVGLRPSLDPDAYFDAPSQDKEDRKTNQNNTAVGLDRPRSFRNDLCLRRWTAVGVEVERPQRSEDKRPRGRRGSAAYSVGRDEVKTLWFKSSGAFLRKLGARDGCACRRPALSGSTDNSPAT